MCAVLLFCFVFVYVVCCILRGHTTELRCVCVCCVRCVCVCCVRCVPCVVCVCACVLALRITMLPWLCVVLRLLKSTTCGLCIYNHYACEGRAAR